MRLTDAHALLADTAGAPPGAAAMRIVHCFRSPVGGLFRHVRDLVEAQDRAGNRVGIICDSTTGGAYEDKLFADIAPNLALGLKRTPMRRQIAPSDLAATWRLLRQIRSSHPDILHAHGAKGGAYARVIGTLLRASGTRVARIYTPHGGSLHYDAHSLGGRVYFLVERVLSWMTDAFIFVSQYEADAYASKVGRTRRPVALVRNGLRPEEFEPVTPALDARDFLYIGMLRDLKGPDVFISALARIAEHTGRAPSALIVGAGDDKERYQAMTAELGLTDSIEFRAPMPAREAFALAKAVVVPSRAESMPYIVLETIAAGVPIVATNVGGIPEIFGPNADLLVPPSDAGELANAMMALMAKPHVARQTAERLKSHIRALFTVDAMANAVAAVYRTATSH
jgi:glycosyltransferase involved in cell wall biosynthesis